MDKNVTEMERKKRLRYEQRLYSDTDSDSEEEDQANQQNLENYYRAALQDVSPKMQQLVESHVLSWKRKYK